MAEQFKKDDLEQIKSLKKEVESIQNELHNLPMTFDTVEGCTPERWDKHVASMRRGGVDECTECAVHHDRPTAL